MKKLRTAIQYECCTSFKYIWIFYSIVFAVILAVAAIVSIGTGSTEKAGVNALETNTMIYVCILSIVGFKEDFKILIQNGFTRKYVFIASFSLFAFVSGIMATVDTIMARVLHLLYTNYDSVFGGIYGDGHSVFINWLWLFLVYMFVCAAVYLITLIMNKIGRNKAICVGILLGLTIMLIIPALILAVFPEDFSDKALILLERCMGFMADGTISFIYPVLLFAGLAAILGVCSYFVVKRTELKV